MKNGGEVIYMGDREGNTVILSAAKAEKRKAATGLFGIRILTAIDLR